MANDALDPGPDGTYPWWPRNPDGTWDAVRMPTGVHRQRDRATGETILIDLTPRHPDGTPIIPPGLIPPT